MKSKLLVAALLLVVEFSAGWAQTGDRSGASGKASPVPDISLPIPIVKGVVDSIVNEQRAIILTPDQMESIKQTTSKFRETEPFQYPNKFIAKPVVRSIYIEPDATQQPRMVRLFLGTISSLVFSDRNGNPWFISAVSFDCTQFDDGRTCKRGDDKGTSSPTNLVKLQPIKPYAYGSIVIELEGLSSPITFMLSTGQSDENDIRIEARVSGRNPNAKPQAIVIDKMPDLDPLLGYFLDGVAPPGAIRLKIEGGQAEGWTINGKLYLRTRLSILSPAFKDHAGSADGTHVYKFYSVYPSVLASANGKPTTLLVTGY